MQKRKKSRVWWWLVLIVPFAALIGYAIRLQMKPGPDQGAQIQAPPSPEKAAEIPHMPTAGEEKAVPGPLPGEEVRPEVLPEGDPCASIKENMADFFLYLDGKNYFRHLSPDKNSKACFKKILERMAAHPPIPAGEGIDPRLIIGNMYHFFRALDRKSLRLIKEIIINEQDSWEFNLQMLYQWLTFGDKCPNLDGLRPPQGIVYQYAGFFLNTIGGRSYLFRRPPSLRLLVTYYSLLIVHDAEMRGKNNYGIDIFPYIAPLKYEFERYPDFQFQREYINRLNEIENYYLRRR